MASPQAIRDVTRHQQNVGLYSLVAAVKGLPSGKRAWESAVEKNERRSKKLQTPLITEGRVPGKRQITKITHVSQISSSVRFVLTDEEAEVFSGNSELVEALSDLVQACGGYAESVAVGARMVLSERQLASQLQRVLCPDGSAGDVRLTVEAGVVYGSILDYLSVRLGLDGPNSWSNWLKADFETWLELLGCNLKGADEVAHGATRISPRLIYHKPDGESHATPMTTYEGFCYITRRCVGRSKVSDAVADEALLCLSRYKVGDASMHRELEENSKSAAPEERAFVLGVQGAQCQIQQTDYFTNPPPDVIQQFWKLTIKEKADTFRVEEEGKRSVFKADEESKMRKLKAEEETICIEEAGKRNVFKAEEEARARISKADEEAHTRTLKAGEESKMRKLKAEEETVCIEEAGKRNVFKADEEARARTSKADEEARARTSKADEEARARTSKADEEAHTRTSKVNEQATIKLLKSKAYAEAATILAGKKRDIATFRAEELEAMERVLAVTARLPVVVPPVVDPPAVNPPAVEGTGGAKRSRRVGVGDNPDFVSYRAAGISDDQIPKDRKETDAWYKKAFAIQLKNRPSGWNNACMRLYEFGARDISGNSVRREMCCPPLRLPFA
jgi:hypothetical protein